MRRLTLTLICFVAAVAVIMVTPRAKAGGCYSGYSYYTPTYYTPTYSYYTPTYSYPVYYPVVYEKPVAVAVQSHDCYTASVRDYYRDSLLSDSIAFKVLTGSRAGVYQGGKLPAYGGADEYPSAGKGVSGYSQPPAQPQPPPQPAANVNPQPPTPQVPSPPTPRMPQADGETSLRPQAIRTQVSAGLVSYLTEACVSCHGPKKQDKGIRLDNPATVSADVRDRCFREVSAGKMPKDGKPATEAQLAEVYKWCEDGGKALETQQSARVKGPRFIRPSLQSPAVSPQQPGSRQVQQPSEVIVRSSKPHDYRKQDGRVPGR